jgi:hypothetical protein
MTHLAGAEKFALDMDAENAIIELHLTETRAFVLSSTLAQTTKYFAHVHAPVFALFP